MGRKLAVEKPHMHEFNMRLAKFFTKRRESLGLNKQQVAVLSDTARMSVFNSEKGEKDQAFETVIRYCLIYDIDMRDIMQLLIDTIKELSPDDLLAMYADRYTHLKKKTILKKRGASGKR